MKKFLFVLGILISGGAAMATLVSPSASAMGERFVSVNWRYKMTVEVETPEGTKAGSAVREIANAVPLLDLPDVGNPAWVTGEAVVVDLGKRGVLFALISHQSDDEFYRAFPVPKEMAPTTTDGIKYFASLPLGSKRGLGPHEPPGYPKLVMFTDLNDPKTVTLAQIWKRTEDGLFELKEDRMEKLFGAGVHLQDITLEITDEPVTSGRVENYLPWITNLQTALDGARIVTSNKLANNLGKGSFIIQ